MTDFEAESGRATELPPGYHERMCRYTTHICKVSKKALDLAEEFVASDKDPRLEFEGAGVKVVITR